MMSGVRRRPDAIWRLRRSPLVRTALFWVVKACVAMLAVVLVITLFFVWAFGHPLAWSIIGCLFALLPLAGLVLTVGVGLRAAVVAGPGRIAVRFFGRWRVVDLGQVRAVRLGDQGPFGGSGGLRGFGTFGSAGGFGGFGGFGGAGGFSAFGGRSGPGGGPGDAGGGGAGGVAGGGARTLVFEDVHGQRVVIGVDALDAGLAAMVRDGLAPDAVIDADAAVALGRGSDPDVTTDVPDSDTPDHGVGDRP
jgi:hypothetical protein